MTKITLDLKESQWAELIYALKDKINGISTGKYGRACERSENERWIADWVADLETTCHTIETKMQKKDLVW